MVAEVSTKTTKKTSQDGATMVYAETMVEKSIMTVIMVEEAVIVVVVNTDMATEDVKTTSINWSNNKVRFTYNDH